MRGTAVATWLGALVYWWQLRRPAIRESGQVPTCSTGSGLRVTQRERHRSRTAVRQHDVTGSHVSAMQVRVRSL